MKIAVTFSSKDGLMTQFKKRFNGNGHADIPVDFFAEGDSPETISAVLGALRAGGHEVTGIEADEKAAARLERLRPQLVFNMAEGLFGDLRESFIPFICEQLGLAYTGSDPLTLAICLNKARSKEILSYHGIANAAFRVFHPGQDIEINGFAFPAIIKPVSEGSSKGIFDDSVVDNAVHAAHKIRDKMAVYDQAVVMEKFLPGQEFTVAIWGNGDETEVLPIIAINYGDLPTGARPIYSYEAKWIWDTPDKPLRIFQCPANVAVELEKQIKELALRAYRTMGIRDWCRIDVRMDEQGIAHILELNPLPGILPNPEDNSCFPKAARTAGYDYISMLNKLVDIAARRHGLPINEYKREDVESTCCL